jgi:hypothetical protein
MLKTLFFNENRIYNNTSIITNHQNIIPHQNLIFVKLKLVSQPNRIINFTNSDIRLLCGKVSEAELKLVKQSSPKQVLNYTMHVM